MTANVSMSESLGHAGATPADTARANGWTVGTRLVGDEGYGPTTIEITAVGREQVLAVTTDGTYPRRESVWDVRCRDWQVADAHVIAGRSCSCGWSAPVDDPVWLVRAHEHMTATNATRHDGHAHHTAAQPPGPGTSDTGRRQAREMWEGARGGKAETEEGA